MTSKEKLYRLQEALRLLLDIRGAQGVSLSNWELDTCISKLEGLIVTIKVDMKGEK